VEYMEQLISGGASEEKVWAEFESIAAELDGCLCRRIPLTVARRFSAILPAFRAFVPGATRLGVLRVLIDTGMIFAMEPKGIALLGGRAALSAPLPDINDANTEDCLCRYLDEEFSAKFVESVMRVRATHPGATTYWVFLAMLSRALSFAESPKNLRLLQHKNTKRPARANKARVRGV
jgi:hypothetical protein